MNSAIVPYIFESHEIRTVTDAHGEPLFCGKDVAVALGYSDPTNAIKQHCNGVAFHHPIMDRLGRPQEARFITEPDMLRLIISSKLESAQRFERWVFEEVLPTIRKTGSYSTPRFYDQGSETIFRMLLAADEAKHRLDQVERRLLQVEGTREEFVSISGWASLRGRKLSRQQATIMGRVAAKQCRLRGIDPGTVIHPAFGRVNTYPLDLLDELFG